MADMKELEDKDGVPEDEPRESACRMYKKLSY